MSAEPVALIPQCAQCCRVWLPADGDRWQAHLGSDSLDDPGELVFYCPTCAEREFSED